MPAAPPFLPHGWILGAADGYKLLVPADTDIAADALPDILDAAFTDFVGEKWVGDRRPRRADQVNYPATDGCDHRFRGGIPSNSHHRLAGEGFYEGNIAVLETLFIEPGCARVVIPITDIDIPQVGGFCQHRHDIVPFPLVGDALLPEQLIHRQAYRHSAGVPNRFLCIFDQLTQEADAVLQAAAIFVRAVIIAAQQKMHRQGQVVTGIAVDDIKSGSFCTDGSLAVPDPDVSDIRFVHPAGLAGAGADS